MPDTRSLTLVRTSTMADMIATSQLMQPNDPEWLRQKAAAATYVQRRLAEDVELRELVLEALGIAA